MKRKYLRPVTYKLEEGQSILLGSLGRLDFISGAPYFFTVFVAPTCTLHVCKNANADRLLQTHGGTLFQPPNTIYRAQLPEFKPIFKKEWEIEGIGWQASVCDVVFPGIGWIAITGCGKIKLHGYAPKDLKIGIRKPLIPRDTYKNVRKYYGKPSFHGR